MTEVEQPPLLLGGRYELREHIGRFVQLGGMMNGLVEPFDRPDVAGSDQRHNVVIGPPQQLQDEQGAEKPGRPGH